MDQEFSQLEKISDPTSYLEPHYLNRCRCFNPKCHGNRWTNFYGNRYTIRFWLYYFLKKN
jgi:hypothetical protein